MIEDRGYSAWCRSNKCTRIAEYHVSIQNAHRSEKYDGDFCRKHLFRMLPIRVVTIRTTDILVIVKKVKW